MQSGLIRRHWARKSSPTMSGILWSEMTTAKSRLAMSGRASSGLEQASTRNCSHSSVTLRVASTMGSSSTTRMWGWIGSELIEGRIGAQPVPGMTDRMREGSAGYVGKMPRCALV